MYHKEMIVSNGGSGKMPGPVAQMGERGPLELQNR
jgi:hypothetical protein